MMLYLSNTPLIQSVLLVVLYLIVIHVDTEGMGLGVVGGKVVDTEGMGLGVVGGKGGRRGHLISHKIEKIFEDLITLYI